MIVQTPGVYIKEKSLLPNSVAGVSTAVPAFIGFTEIVPIDPTTQLREVMRITSMFEFENAFGGAYLPHFDINLGVVPNELVVDKRFFLYDSLSLYFRNGGGPCYIISAGVYNDATQVDAPGYLNNQLIELDHLDEATIAVMPDMHMQFNNGGNQEGFAPSEYGSLCSQMITKCAKLKDKFAIIDYHSPENTALEIRSLITPTSNDIKYGAVYYPWLIDTSKFGISTDQLTLSGATASTLKDTLTDVNADISSLITEYGQVYDLTALNNNYFDLEELARNAIPANKAKLTDLFDFLFGLVENLDDSYVLGDSTLEAYRVALSSNSNFMNQVSNLFHFSNIVSAKLSASFPGIEPNGQWFTNHLGSNDYSDFVTNTNPTFVYTAGTNNSEILNDLNSGQYVDLNIIFSAIAGLFDMAFSRKKMIEDQLFTTDADYINANALVQTYMRQIPAQGAMAGIYCKNDRDRGVWKSPANIAVQGIVKPMVEVSNAEQDRLNVDADTGKSINVIRTFTGKGSLVWGARTLDGQSNEWRYISVRRFFSFAEESIMKAMNPFVFEPNNARTWVKIKAMVTSFLVEQWKAGALVGTSLEEAFFVRVGKDTTSETEILEGKINVQIGMAVARPAEFIILEFSHYSKA
jgi:phage tail sheath protein FI